MSENQMLNKLRIWVKSNLDAFVTINNSLEHLITTAGTSQEAWSRLHSRFYEARWEHLLNMPAGITEQQAIKWLPSSIEYLSPFKDNQRRSRMLQFLRIQDLRIPNPYDTLRTWTFNHNDWLAEFYETHDPNADGYRKDFWLGLENNALHLPPNVPLDYALTGFGKFLWEIERSRAESASAVATIIATPAADAAAA